MSELLRSMEPFGRGAIDTLHRSIVHPLLTRGAASEDREIAHERALELAEAVQNSPHTLALAQKLFSYEDTILQTTFLGVEAPNPLGIAAGFDKNAAIHRFLGEGQGFGFVTVGSITKVPYEGNGRPRIFDLPIHDGIINRMGFPGNGVDKAQEKLAEDNARWRDYGLVVNLAASKPSFERGRAIEDYVEAAEQLRPYGDIHEINVSSPNTEGVRGLQDPTVFSELAQGVSQVYGKPGEEGSKPFIFKFSPDLEMPILEADITIAIDAGASGISVTNTTTDTRIRSTLLDETNGAEMGGISGSPLREKALSFSNTVFEYTSGTLPIKRAGGIQTAEDAWKALTYGGAEIVDVYTAYVRPTTSTPHFVRYMLTDLAKGMRAIGMEGMQDFNALRGKQIAFPKTR